MASAQPQACARGPGKGEEAGREEQGPKLAGREEPWLDMQSGTRGPHNQATQCSSACQSSENLPLHKRGNSGPETEGTCPRSHYRVQRN